MQSRKNETRVKELDLLVAAVGESIIVLQKEHVMGGAYSYRVNV